MAAELPEQGRTRFSGARYRRILRFAAGAMVQVWWFELVLPRIGLARIAARGRDARLTRLARRFHALAVRLGGLMIKVGQFLSSRLDVLPPAVTSELEGLQDEVPAVPFAELAAVAEAELGHPPAQVYAHIDPTPIAAASLGQVHRVRLAVTDVEDTGIADGVVKIQRPGIDGIVATDLAALRTVARWLSRVRLVARRVDMPQLVEEFARTCREEVDYLHEAAAAERFAEAFAGDARVGAPTVIWERTTRRVLTLADVTAIKINDVAALRAAGIDPTAVAAEFAAVMFDQLFVHGHFHADPHPGNIFVTPTPDGERPWRLTFIDFGMMGTVSDDLRGGLRRLLIAAAARDGKGLVAGMREVGVLLPGADGADLERAMSALFDRFGGMGFAELQRVDERELRDFADEFGDVMRSLPFQLPEDFLLIIRAMSLTSGLCSALEPAFNVWEAVEPYAARLLSDEGGGIVREIGGRIAAEAGTLARLPGRIDGIITRLEDGTLVVDSPRLDRRLSRLERIGRRAVGAVLFAGLLIGGAVLRADDAMLGAVLMWASLVPLGYAIFPGVRR